LKQIDLEGLFLSLSVRQASCGVRGSNLSGFQQLPADRILYE